jgi:hypothetical protein
VKEIGDDRVHRAVAIWIERIDSGRSSRATHFLGHCSF